MASVMIDTHFWDTREVLELCEQLCDDNAWCYIVRIEAFAMNLHAEDGIIKIPDRKLAQICGYFGDEKKLKNALISTGFLIQQDMQETTYLLRGWDKYKRYFNERKRLKKIDELRREERAQRRESAENATRGATRGATGGTTCINLNLNSNFNNKKKIQKEKSPTPSSPDVEAVIEHYKTHRPKSRPGDKERRQISARLRDGYSVSDLCSAIDGCFKTPHNLGDNDRGQKYLDLELIVRSSSHVDRFVANDKDPPTGNRPRNPTRGRLAHGNFDNVKTKLLPGTDIEVVDIESYLNG